MHVLSLIKRAKLAGLTVTSSDGKLVVKGADKRFLPLAEEMGRHKDQILAILDSNAEDEAERDAARWADTTEADDALEQAIRDWDAQLKAHEPPPIDVIDPNQLWQATLDRLEDDLLFPSDVINSMRESRAMWVNDTESDIAIRDTIKTPAFPIDLSGRSTVERCASQIAETCDPCSSGAAHDNDVRLRQK